MSDTVTLLLALEARDKATQILEAIAGKIKSVETAIKTAAGVSTRSTEEIEAANLKAAASTASYERAVASQATAQKALQEAMLATKAAQLEADAAVREGSVSVKAAAAQVTTAAEAEEAALIKLQKAEALVATRSKEMAAAQEATATKTSAGVVSLKSVTVAAGATALAVGYIGEKSLHAAADFESSTTRLVTSAGESRDNIDKVRQGMLTMAGDVGYSSEALAAAMYKVDGATFHGAESLQILKAAAQGAKAENADLTTVADALSSAMKDYGYHGDQAAAVTSKLVEATAQGKMTFEEMSGALANILPNAAAAHISLDDILGSLASMTVHGMSAQRATQNLADVINHLQKPTDAMTKEFALLGLQSNDVTNSLSERGLSGTLKLLSERIQQAMPPGSKQVILELGSALGKLSPKVQELGAKLLDGSMSMKDYTKAAQALDPISAKQALSFATLAGQTHRIGEAQLDGKTVLQNYSQALGKATGDAVGLRTALMLTGENLDTTQSAVKKVSEATADASGNVKGWGEVQSTFNYKMASLKGHLEATKIAIGSGLLPVASALAGKVAAIVTPVAEWTVHHQRLSSIILGSIGGIGALIVLVVGAVKAFELVKTAIMGVRVAMVAMKLATIEADAAFALSPIGMIVIALVALAAAVWYCWNHFAGFRKVVLEAWDGIKVAALATWNGVLKPAFEGIKVAIMQGVVPAALWLWRNALEPAFKGIGAAAVWLWGSVLKPTFLGLEWLFKNVIAPAALWLWHNVLEPAWKGIEVAISVAWAVIKVVFKAVETIIKDVLAPIFLWLYNNVIMPVWQGIQLAISIAWAVIQVTWGLIQIAVKVLAAIFTWLWKNVIEPVWQGIAAIISWAWDNIIKPLWEVIKADIHVLAVIFQWLWHNVLEPVWHGIADTISWVWHNVIKPVFDFFGNIIKEQVEPAFRSGVDAIGKAWDGLKDIAKIPVKFVVNTILNDGLLAAYNWVAKTFGVKPDNVHVDLPAGFATGGHIRGPGTGTSDSILARLSNGEYVIPAATVSRWGVGFFDELIGARPSSRKYPGDGSAGLPAFAEGGLVGFLDGLGSKLWDLFTDPGKLIRGPVNALIDKIPGAGNLRDVVVGGAHKLLDGLISWVKGSSDSGGTGRAMAFLKAQEGKPYIWASAGPDGYDCSGIVSAVYNVLKGANPYSHTFSTSNEAPFFPLSGPGGLLTAGWTNPGEPGPGGNGVGHTAAVLAGMPFESTGSGGVHLGAGVTPVGAFAHVGHFDSGGPLYPGWTAAYNGTGHTEWVSVDRPGHGEQTVIVDLRGSHFMSDRDIDMLLDRIDKRLVRVLLPGAGVQVRR